MVIRQLRLEGSRAIVGEALRKSPSSPVEARVAAWVEAIGFLQTRDGEEAEIAVVRLQGLEPLGR